MNKHPSYTNIGYSLLHISENNPILRNKLFDVPMRLFRQNYDFQKVILKIISCMETVLNSKYDDYPELKGISGANIGIPYNIVVIKTRRKNKIFLNPKIINSSKKMVEVKSNCGSVRLKNPIKIMRHTKIFVSWYDEKFGHHHLKWFEGQIGNTLQHEIEHNLGILITDKTGGPVK